MIELEAVQKIVTGYQYKQRLQLVSDWPVMNGNKSIACFCLYNGPSVPDGLQSSISFCRIRNSQPKEATFPLAGTRSIRSLMSPKKARLYARKVPVRDSHWLGLAYMITVW